MAEGPAIKGIEIGKTAKFSNSESDPRKICEVHLFQKLKILVVFGISIFV